MTGATLLSLALLWWWSEQASGQVPASLHWHAAVGCPDAAAGHKAIEDLLAPHGLRGVWRADVSVTITRRADSRWQAQVAIRDANGLSERRLDGVRCSSVAEAAALVAAMALETIAESERAASSTTVAPIAPPESDDGLGLTLGARAAFDVGSLPLPSAGVGPVLGFEIAAWRLSAAATFWLPRFAAGPEPGLGAQISLWSVSVQGCYLVLRVVGLLGLEACAAAEAGLSHGDGVGLLDMEQQRAPWAALMAGVSLRQRSHAGFSSGVALELGAPLLVSNYVVTDFGLVFRAGPLVGRIMIDLAWTFR